MNMHNRLSILCTILSLTAMSIHARHLETNHQPEKLVPLSNDDFDQYVLVGQGLRSSDRPIIKCDPIENSTNSYAWECEFYEDSVKKCSHSINDNYTEVLVSNFRQISESKLFIELTTKFDEYSIPDKEIVIYDIDSCSLKQIDSWPYSTSIAHEAGFYVISERYVAKYNTEGRRIGELEKYVLRDTYLSDIALIEDQSGDEKFFVTLTDNEKAKLYLVDSEWKFAEMLMDFGDGFDNFVNHANESLYAVCWNEANATATIDCRQYDEFGNETLNQRIQLVGEQMLVGVRNLRGGGLAFVTIGLDLKVLHLATIQTHPRAISIDNYFLTHRGWMMKLTEFDEEARMFEIAYKFAAENVKPAMFSQKFEF